MDPSLSDFLRSNPSILSNPLVLAAFIKAISGGSPEAKLFTPYPQTMTGPQFQAPFINLHPKMTPAIPRIDPSFLMEQSRTGGPGGPA